ncbi:MAG: hypothetical protein M0P71_01595 [Melioribacteraceae bacterium]|nr:hypothetical protein [Melioribacteraceae bacterium]
MKLKIKCPECKREHLVTISNEQPIMEIKKIKCLSCSIIIKYRIGIKKENTSDSSSKLFDSMGMFGDVFKNIMGSKR